jgi:hypothetical protein
MDTRKKKLKLNVIRDDECVIVSCDNKTPNSERKVLEWSLKPVTNRLKLTKTKRPHPLSSSSPKSKTKLTSSSSLVPTFSSDCPLVPFSSSRQRTISSYFQPTTPPISSRSNTPLPSPSSDFPKVKTSTNTSNNKLSGNVDSGYSSPLCSEVNGCKCKSNMCPFQTKIQSAKISSSKKRKSTVKVSTAANVSRTPRKIRTRAQSKRDKQKLQCSTTAVKKAKTILSSQKCSSKSKRAQKCTESALLSRPETSLQDDLDKSVPTSRRAKISDSHVLEESKGKFNLKYLIS